MGKGMTQDAQVVPFSWCQNVTALQLSCGSINWFRMISVEQLSSLKKSQCNLLATATLYQVWIMLYKGFRCSHKLTVIKYMCVIIQWDHLIHMMKTKEQNSDKRSEGDNPHTADKKSNVLKLLLIYRSLSSEISSSPKIFLGTVMRLWERTR